MVKSGLRLNAKICSFICKEVVFLRHMVTQNRIKSDSFKIEAVKSIPSPTNISEL